MRCVIARHDPADTADPRPAPAARAGDEDNLLVQWLRPRANGGDCLKLTYRWTFMPGAAARRQRCGLRSLVPDTAQTASGRVLSHALDIVLKCGSSRCRFSIGATTRTSASPHLGTRSSARTEARRASATAKAAEPRPGDSRAASSGRTTLDGAPTVACFRTCAA